MTSSAVSVVIVTRNRLSSLMTTLAHTRRAGSDYPVMVVDNGSTDGTAEAVHAHFPGVQLLRSERNMGAPGRNVGVRHASTPYVAFSDDDSWWAPGALERAVEALDASPRLALVAGRVEVGSDRCVDPTSIAMASSPIPPEPDLPGPPVLGFLACAAVVRRSAYVAVGGFSDLLFFGGEEALLAVDLAEAGWGLAYLDDVVAHHHPDRRRDSRARQRRVARNELLATWMRRRPRPAVRATARALARATRDADARRGVLGAFAALPTALQQRRVIDATLDRQLQLLDRARLG